MPSKPQIHRAHTPTKPRQQANPEKDRLYGRRWKRAAHAHLANDPFCVLCEAQLIVRLATVVDHIKPHKGDMELFWDATNWQSLCKTCHDQKTVREDGGLGRKAKTQEEPTP